MGRRARPRVLRGDWGRGARSAVRCRGSAARPHDPRGATARGRPLAPPGVRPRRGPVRAVVEDQAGGVGGGASPGCGPPPGGDRASPSSYELTRREPGRARARAGLTRANPATWRAAVGPPARRLGGIPSRRGPGNNRQDRARPQPRVGGGGCRPRRNRQAGPSAPRVGGATRREARSQSWCGLDSPLNTAGAMVAAGSRLAPSPLICGV